MRVLLLGILAVLGCGEKEKARPHAVSVTSRAAIPPSIEILIAGKSVEYQRVGKDEIQFWFEVSRDDVAMRVTTPCGKVKPTFAWESDYRVKLDPIEPETHIAIDNVDSDAQELQIGDASLRLAKNRRREIVVHGWTCGKRPVVVDGERLGEIAPERENWILIDVTGKHCYELAEQHYGEAPASDRTPTRLPQQHLHSIQVDHVFFAPSTVESSSRLRSEARTVVNDCR